MRTYDDSNLVEGTVGPRRRRDASGESLGSPAAAILHLQRTAGNAAVAQLLEDRDEESPVKDVVGKGGGRALDDDTRSFMEAGFGRGFNDVRIHTDGKAAESAASVQANAYTVGNDVVFGAGKYSPGTDSGRHMLAHELSHVVQQSAGPVDGTPAPGGIRLSDPSDRFERQADQIADRVMAGDHAGHDHGGPAAGTVQRDEEGGEEEGEDVQMSAVQRQEEMEEEGEEG